MALQKTIAFEDGRQGDYLKAVQIELLRGVEQLYIKCDLFKDAQFRTDGKPPIAEKPYCLTADQLDTNEKKASLVSIMDQIAALSYQAIKLVESGTTDV